MATADSSRSSASIWPYLWLVLLFTLFSLYYLAWGGLTLSHSPVSLGFLALGLKYLWDGRRSRQQMHAQVEEKVIGYGVATLGVSLFFAYQTSASLQHLTLCLTLASLALARWGLNFFARQWLACGLLVVGLYPDLTFISLRVWTLITPPLLVETFVTWVAGNLLRLIHQPAVVEGNAITIFGNTVGVYGGCSGLNIAVSLAGFGLLMGLFFQQSWRRIAVAMVLGIGLALLGNIPRIMLLAYVVGRYDISVFQFWHGPWGGQIFMALIFTPYYYLVMALFQQSPPSSQDRSGNESTR